MYSVCMQGMGWGRLRARWTLAESQDRLFIDPRGLLVVVVALDVVLILMLLLLFLLGTPSNPEFKGCSEESITEVLRGNSPT